MAPAGGEPVTWPGQGSKNSLTLSRTCVWPELVMAKSRTCRIIDLDGNITEFRVSLKQSNVILAGLAFDREGNLWTQSYVDPHNPLPEGPDHIVKLDKAINTAAAGDKIPVTDYEVPTRLTIMHRITPGPDGNMWFTELGTDKLGRVMIRKGK